ncbi:MAG: DNA repair protein RadA [Candidatus Latescibacterota bacterium]|nr:MAG: DNA repair protein RadA [Candidatus Latescibacterota bacterium]RKY73371.1 MAG: DNA repair protein RadA [Candidatus Latescibacterota bacterium]
MTKSKSRYVCQSCGAVAPRWFGRCPECGAWDTCTEEIREPQIGFGLSPGEPPAPLTQVATEEGDRQQTGISELDRVLGGGIVPGSVVLVAGEPGIGKSTLLLQIAGKLSSDNRRVLYASGEESAKQIRMRAERIGCVNPNLFVLAETNLERIISSSEKFPLSAMIIDSVQTVHYPQLESSAGSIAQVRQSTSLLTQLAKRTGLPVFLIGHVTKEGSIAGPKVLEHMVDTVLYLEGDQHHCYRILRAVKNRFGSTNEIGVFEMRESGMVGVENPSAVFLADRSEGEPGCAVACSIEGSRPLLVEIQALVSPTNFGYPQRVTTGLEQRRLSILIAVLEKRVGLHLGAQDIFLKVTGGLRIEEPSADLAAALAIASSFRDLPVDPHTVAIGEIGLGGEVRPVNQIDRRIREVQKLGFKRCLLAQGNLKEWDGSGEIEIVGVARVKDALNKAVSRK